MRAILATTLGLALATGACKDSQTTPSGSSGPSGQSGQPQAAKTPSGAITLEVAYGSEKKTWLEEAARSFAATNPKTKSGKPVLVKATAMGSGETVQGILDGKLKPHVFSPASGAYINILNQRWLSVAGHTKPISPAGEPVVLSPIVIAMWKPLAESLGWPAKSIGWRDILARKSELKLGHTNPELSSSGLLAVLAEAYAGAKKTRGLTLADLDAKETQDFVDSIEHTMVHYGKSTGFFADKMQQRGPEYISAAVLYENLVIESYAPGKPNPGSPIVAVYPVEGTFWADHPYAILDAPWVGDEEREAAKLFLAHLSTRPVQERALALGFRPADPAIAVGAPVDAAHGADPKQPQTLLEVPDAAVLEKIVTLWQRKKKATDVMLVFDRSGSMAGRPLEEAKAGAKAFLTVLGDRDRVSLLPFNNEVPEAAPLAELASGRAAMTSAVDAIVASGGTSLYDAIARANELMRQQAKKEPDRIHAVVVMTDGHDAGSRLDLPGLSRLLSGGSGDSEVKLFTIAYGSEADPQVLEKIAESAKGASAKGSSETIVQVYRDMASFF